MSNHYIASDYASVEGGGLFFYYGYEETLDEEWLFVVKKANETIFFLPASELGVKNTFEVVECLLAGISKWLDESHATDGIAG